MNISQTMMQIAVLAPPVLLAVTIHEVAHGYVADKLGDPTARLAGRLTLNPIKHLDLIGTAVFFLTQMIGWAKPVPVNPYNLQNPKKDLIWVSLAGPISNLCLALIFAVAFRTLAGVRPESRLMMMAFEPFIYMIQAGVFVNVGLAVFNVIPIPPLDGSKVLAGILPQKQAMAYARIGRYGFLILLALIVTGVLGYVVFPVIRFIITLLIG
jgi:Zn-dependent protease